MSDKAAVAIGTLRVEGEMTIYRAVELKDLIFTPGPAVPVLDLSGVTELDTAGVQLLLLAQRDARARGGELRLQAPSAPVREVLDLLGLDQLCAAGGVAA